MDVDEMRNLSDTAQRLENAGDVDGAAECFDRLIRAEPKISLFYICKAKVYIRFKRYEDALACLDNIVGLEHDDNTAWGFYERAYVLYYLGRGAAAIANMNKVIEIDPDYTSAYFSKGVILADQYEMRQDPAALENALRCYDEAASRDESDCNSLYNKGLLLEKAHRTDEALACYDEALSRNPAYYRALTSKGDVFLDSGKYDMAITCYETALQVAPDHPSAMYNMSKALWLCERTEDAYALLQKAYKIDPNLPDCNNILEMLKDRVEFNRRLHDSCQKSHDDNCV